MMTLSEEKKNNPTDRNGHQNAKTHFEKTDLRQPVIRGMFGVGKWFVPRKTIRKKLLKCKVNVNSGYMIKAKIIFQDIFGNKT